VRYDSVEGRRGDRVGQLLSPRGPADGGRPLLEHSDRISSAGREPRDHDRHDEGGRFIRGSRTGAHPVEELWVDDSRESGHRIIVVGQRPERRPVTNSRACRPNGASISPSSEQTRCADHRKAQIDPMKRASRRLVTELIADGVCMRRTTDRLKIDVDDLVADRGQQRLGQPAEDERRSPGPATMGR
jgi:hypothetical protein